MKYQEVISTEVASFYAPSRSLPQPSLIGRRSFVECDPVIIREWAESYSKTMRLKTHENGLKNAFDI